MVIKLPIMQFSGKAASLIKHDPSLTQQIDPKLVVLHPYSFMGITIGITRKDLPPTSVETIKNKFIHALESLTLSSLPFDCILICPCIQFVPEGVRSFIGHIA